MGGGLLALLAGAALSGVTSIVDSAVSSAQSVVRSLVVQAVKSALILALMFCGIAFMLFGVARILDALYQMPGMGELIVGFAALTLSLIAYLFNKDGKSG